MVGVFFPGLDNLLLSKISLERHTGEGERVCREKRGMSLRNNHFSNIISCV